MSSLVKSEGGEVVAKYRKKPVVIEAIQFKDDSEALAQISSWVDDTVSVSYADAPELKINTLEGTMKADVGDYIIKGVQGEFYPCKPDIFEQTYELVE